DRDRRYRQGAGKSDGGDGRERDQRRRVPEWLDVEVEPPLSPLDLLKVDAVVGLVPSGDDVEANHVGGRDALGLQGQVAAGTGRSVKEALGADESLGERGARRGPEPEREQAQAGVVERERSCLGVRVLRD